MIQINEFAAKKRHLRKKPGIAVRILLIFLIAGTGLRADILFLKNQRYIKGQVVEQTLAYVAVKTNSGIDRIPKSKIKKIVYVAADKTAEMDIEAQKQAEERRRQRELERRRRLERERARQEELAHRRREEEARRKKLSEKRKRKLVAEHSEREKRLTEMRNAGLWRSALIPGWGQLHENGKLRAGLIAGTTLAAGFILYSSYRGYTAARDDYDSASNLMLFGVQYPTLALAGYFSGQAARNEMQSNATTTLITSFTLLAVYIYNLFDSWFNVSAGSTAKVKNLRSSVALPHFMFSILPENNARALRQKVRLQWNWRF